MELKFKNILYNKKNSVKKNIYITIYIPIKKKANWYSSTRHFIYLLAS